MVIETAGEVQFGHMHRQVNKLMDQLQKGFFNFCPAETWTPPVNLYENERAYLVCVDLSGVDKEKIELSIADGQLRLRGHREMPVLPEMVDPAGQPWRVHLMEIDHGPFCREVDLPADIDPQRISASYRNGMLWVELPRKA